MNWQKEFINMLFPVSRKDLNIEGAYLLKEKYLPNSIFKYRQIDNNTIKNLEDDTIWLADPNTFNDPYDSAFSVIYSNLMNRYFIKEFDLFLDKSKVTEKLSKEQIQKVRNSNNPISYLMDNLLKDEEESKKKEYENMFEIISNKLIDELLEDFNKTIKNSFKICSFSTNLNSILMWGHYSKKHRGFCIEYDLTAIPYGNYITRFLYPIVYSDNICDVTEFMGTVETNEFNNLHLTLAALTKSKEWSYEEEWRLIFAHGIIEQPQSYYIGKPKTIYLGALISDPDQRRIIEIAEQKSVPVYKMTLSPNRFQLIPKTIEDCRRILKHSV